jgi:Na+/H+ antiporter NhaA
MALRLLSQGQPRGFFLSDGALDWGTLRMPLAVFLGKPVGLLIGLALARAIGLHPPLRVGWRDLTVVAFLSTIGFTMALFFASVAIGPGTVLSEVKMGALLTVAGALMALVAARVLKVGRFAHARQQR